MDIGNLAGQAGELLNQHGDKVDAGLDKVAEIATEKFGHGEQIDMAVDKIKDMIPGEPAAGEAPPAQ